MGRVLSPMATRSIYCRSCWYTLDGLTDRRCPECGRRFDPADRRTYRTKPRRHWWVTVTRRIGLFLAAVLMVLAVVYFWTYSRYASEQRAILGIERAGGLVTSKSIAPDWFLARLPARFRIYFTRVDLVLLQRPKATDSDLDHVVSLKEITAVHLHGATVTDAGVAKLKACRKLKELGLSGARLTGTGLRDIGTIRTLEKLWLNGTSINDASLAYLSNLFKSSRTGSRFYQCNRRRFGPSERSQGS